MQLSVVTTLYYSAPYLNEFCSRICAAAQQITSDFEIVIVNDGSPDNSLEVAISIHERDERVRIIDLSRNFGHHKAIMTGLAHAKGRLVFLLDSDLEEEPELLTKFYTEFTRSCADVVYGVQQSRKGEWFERLSGKIYYKVFNWLSDYPVPANMTTARLMKKAYVSSLVAHRDHEIFLGGLWAITGFHQVPLMVKKHCKGKSTYDLRRKISLFVNSITSFSNKPLVFIFYLGCLISFVSGTAGLYLIIKRVFWGTLLEGWPSLIVSIWLLGGLSIFCLGMIGIYLSKVFMETKDRPNTIIRQIYERKESLFTLDDSLVVADHYQRRVQDS